MPEHPVPPFTVHFHLGDGKEVLSTSGGAWLDRQLDYDEDCLAVWCKNTEFLREPAFVDAYRAAREAGAGLTKAADAKIAWRVHVCIWAACHARLLEGDFVECGVHAGATSLAVCRYIDFNATGKRFFLFDTYCGIPDEQISNREREVNRHVENEQWYEECYEIARRNFAPYPRAELVRGPVPDTLAGSGVGKVCYLSLDMNVAAAERAAIEFFWDRLVPGAIVILDDYGWRAFVEQKRALDEFADARGVKILSLPTGQGLLIKP